MSEVDVIGSAEVERNLNFIICFQFKVIQEKYLGTLFPNEVRQQNI